jgi:hypothetical protein
MEIKVVGKSGQISLGKAMAGMNFILETLADGDILLKHAVVMPVNERWLHEPGSWHAQTNGCATTPPRKPSWRSFRPVLRIKHNLTMSITQSIYARTTVSMTDLKRNPSGIFDVDIKRGVAPLLWFHFGYKVI